MNDSNAKKQPEGPLLEIGQEIDKILAAELGESTGFVLLFEKDRGNWQSTSNMNPADQFAVLGDRMYALSRGKLMLISNRWLVAGIFLSYIIGMLMGTIL